MADRAKFRPYDYDRPTAEEAGRKVGGITRSALNTVDQSARQASDLVMAPFAAGAGAINSGINRATNAVSDFSSGVSSGFSPRSEASPTPQPRTVDQVSPMARTQESIPAPSRGFSPEPAQQVEVYRGAERDAVGFAADPGLPADATRLGGTAAGAIPRDDFIPEGSDETAPARGFTGERFATVPGTDDVYYAGSGQYFQRGMPGQGFASAEEAAAGQSFANQVKEQTIEKLASAAGLNVAKTGLTEVKTDLLPMEVAADAAYKRDMGQAALRPEAVDQAEAAGFDPINAYSTTTGVGGSVEQTRQTYIPTETGLRTPEGLTPQQVSIRQRMGGNREALRSMYDAAQGDPADLDLFYRLFPDYTP